MQSASRQLAPLDFTARMRLVCDDMVARLPEMAHVDMTRVAVAFTQARRPVLHGLYASLTPLRFKDGAETSRRRGRTYRIQGLRDKSGWEMLYILRFCLPRFLNLDLREKLITVLHELWHISPEFNGDIRRHAGRYHAHTHSQAEYDAQMGVLADRWLRLRPPDELWEFLRHDFDALYNRHGRIVGVRIPRPLLVPVE
jgi:predicted metallopeptidase